MSSDRHAKRDRRIVDSPTYRRIKWEINDRDYERIINTERSRYGLPPVVKQAAENR
jgi:hypothetical protein